MFPGEPYRVGGCMYNLTRTTQVQTRQTLPVARVQGDYYRLSLATRHGSSSRVQTLAGTACRYIQARTSSPLFVLEQHAAKGEAAHILFTAPSGGAGQRASTVPTSTTQRCMYNIAHSFKICKVGIPAPIFKPFL